MRDWNAWLYGLLHGVISSIASGVVVVIVDPHTFSEWDKLLKITGALGIWGAAMYLKQSPLPAEIPPKTKAAGAGEQ